MTTPSQAPDFGLIIIGDEILSGKRADKHLPKVIEMLHARGLSLAWAEYVGDSPERITRALRRAFSSGDVVFSTGGIGATPDDHTRQCAARALGLDLALHPEAEVLIRQRIQDLAKEQGTVYQKDHPDNIHRLNMGVFPLGAQIIPNPYNQIPGFYCPGKNASDDATGELQAVQGDAGTVYFVPGFPVMAWPMIEWVLETRYSHLFSQAIWVEQSIIVYGSMEATLTPLMIEIERLHSGVKVFSLPSVDHPTHGRHIELGVKGDPESVAQAYPAMLTGLKALSAKLGPEMVRN